MFDRWKKFKTAGSLLIAAALILFVALNVRIRSVDAYKKEQNNKMFGGEISQTQESANPQKGTESQESQNAQEMQSIQDAVLETQSKHTAAEETAKAESGAQPETSSQKETNPQKETSPQSQENTNPQKETNPQETSVAAGGADTQAKISVRLAITCASAAKIRDTVKNPGLRDKIPESGVILEKSGYSIPEGSNVYELLSGAAAANQIMITANADKSYVTSINGLSQMMLSQQSGWKYSVNGKIPGQAAKNYILQDGDEVEWFYVLSANEREAQGG